MNVGETNDTAWIEKEAQRLEELREELKKASSILRGETEALSAQQKELGEEKKQLEQDMREFERFVERERETLKEEQKLFDKKLQMLEIGFKKLEADRKKFESQKRAFEWKRLEKEHVSGFDSFEDVLNDANASDMFFFRGVKHPLALKKRYKELIKIYHPDNLDGDKSILQQINREYESLKKIINYQRKA